MEASPKSKTAPETKEKDPYPIPGFVWDIRDLIVEWRKASSFSYQHFKEAWKRLEFSYIHAGRTELLTKREYVNSLYHAAYGYIVVNDLQLRIGGLYALYTLYYTQPNQPRMAIPISIGLWKEIVLLQQQAIHIGNKEAYAIIRRLKQDNAFLFSASVPIIPPPGIVTETTSNVITLRPDILHANTTEGVVDFNSMNEIHEAYNKAKLQKTGAPLENSPSLNVIHANFTNDLSSMINEAQQTMSKINEADLSTQLDQMIHSDNTQDNSNVILNNNSNGALSPGLTLSTTKKKKKRVFDEIQTEDEVKTYNPSDYLYEDTVKRLKRPPRQQNRRTSSEASNTNVNTNNTNNNNMIVDEGLSDNSSSDDF